MLVAFVILTLTATAASVSAFNATDPASLQLENFKRNTTGSIGILRVSSGCPVQNKYAASSINTNLLRNEYFIDSITHLLSERTPERLVHAKGSGAFGYFEVTRDVTDLCKAKFLSCIGKRTRVAARFSPVEPSKGGNDLAFAVRGFAIKFYTEEGNFDLPGFNIPVFISQDPVKFVSFTRSFKGNPATNLNDANMAWDFITINPESLLAILIAFSELGTPASNARMRGYGVHTMQLSNSKNETNFARFYFIPDLGVKNFTADEAFKIGASDPDYLTRELYNAIGQGDYPSWSVYMQPLTLDDVQSARNQGFDVFDVSKILSEEDYPYRLIGKMVLNENPKNYFADIEQLGFCPGNLVPGILGAPDKMFEARAMAYRTAIAHRLGINFNKLPVNRPIGKIFTSNRDGKPSIDENEGGSPNYYPNLFNGAEPISVNQPSLIELAEIKSSNAWQSRHFYENLCTADKRDAIAHNIANSFKGLIEDIEKKAIKLLANISQDLAYRVSEAVIKLRTSNSGST